MTSLALSRPLCVLDVETTGLDCRTDRVVEVAVLKVQPDGTQTLGHRRINPGRPVPPAATAVHGLTDADLIGCLRFADIAPRLLAFLGECDLAGFNLAFDVGFLNAELIRARLPPLDLAGRACVDVLALFRRQKPHTLAGAAVEYLGADHPAAHSADGDVVATLAVLAAQLARDPALPRTPAGLHELLVEVDLAGRLRHGPAGKPVLGFGKYRGRSLAAVAATDPGYLLWALNALPLLGDARRLVLAALTPSDRSTDPRPSPAGAS